MVVSYVFGYSRRFEMIVLLLSGVAVNYTLRVSMSVAAPVMAEAYGWSVNDEGLVLSSYYWGYAAGQIPFSKLAQYVGAKPLFGISVLFPAILSLIIPRVANKSVNAVIAVRAFMGLFSAACFPSSFHFFPFWVPPEEKTVLVPLFYLGMYLGEILGFSIGGGFLANQGWEPIFYFFGAVGIAWFPMWWYMAHETPQVHPKISSDELQIFERASKQNMSSMSIRFSKDSVSPTEGTNTPEIPSTPRSPSTLNKALINVHQKSSDTLESQDDQPAPRLSNTSTVSQKDRNSSFHPMTGASEQVLVRIDEVNSMAASTRAQARKTPWLAFFTNPSSLTLLLASWTHGWTGFLVLSELPSYLNKQLGFGSSNAALLSVLPYIALAVSTYGFSEFFRTMQDKFVWRTRSVRQVAQLTSFLGSGTCLLIAGFVTNPGGGLALMILTQLFFGATNSGLGCAYLDLAPRFSGNYNSTGNMMAALAGIAGPIAVANFISSYGGTAGWQASFELTFATSAFACFFWVIFQTSDIDPVLNAPADGWGSVKGLKPIIDEKNESSDEVVNPIQSMQK